MLIITLLVFLLPFPASWKSKCPRDEVSSTLLFFIPFFWVIAHFKDPFTHSMPCLCRAHAVPLPCRAAKGLECVFPIWFTQCGRVWFTVAMPCSDHAVLLKATAQHDRRETACGLPARVRLLPATTRSSTKIVIRSIPILLTTIHT